MHVRHMHMNTSSQRRRERAQLSGIGVVGEGSSSLGRLAPPAAGLFSGELKGFVFPPQPRAPGNSCPRNSLHSEILSGVCATVTPAQQQRV